MTSIFCCDRIIGINAGKIVFDGPTEKINNDILKMIYGRELTDDDMMKEKKDD